jgi:pyridoxamine 5'-phosphate oxidase
MARSRSIEKLRFEYGNTPLLEEELHPDPIEQFRLWLGEAIDSQIPEPNGMVLATVSSAGRPTSRTVLLKHFDSHGFCFYTNYLSRKGEHLALTPYGSLTFWWREVFRQVHLEGKIVKTKRSESIHYFHKRPRGAQLASIASSQSAPLASRYELEEAYLRLQKKYRGKEIPCPKHWGGYRLIPERIEFWQGRANRLHDRFLYVKIDSFWIISRLSP